MPLLLCDTRQHAGKHANIDGWLDRHGVPYEYRKLDFGDYMVEGSNVSVDTKRDMAEVCGNCGRDHARFVREMERARAAGYRLVILTEASGYHDLHDVAGWTNSVCRRCERRRMGTCDPAVSMGCAEHRHKPMQGATLARTMRTLEANHGVRFEFCHPMHTAARICELLGLEVSE